MESEERSSSRAFETQAGSVHPVAPELVAQVQFQAQPVVPRGQHGQGRPLGLKGVDELVAHHAGHLLGARLGHDRGADVPDHAKQGVGVDRINQFFSPGALSPVLKLPSGPPGRRHPPVA